MTDYQPPYSQQSEEAVLGAVLTAPLAYLNIAAFLSAEDFFFVRHSYIWQAIGRLEQRGDPVDTVTVSEELQAANQLVEIGGPAFLTQLIRNTPTSAHAEVYGLMVRRCAQRRQLMQAADTINALAVDEELGIKEIFTLSEAKLMSVTVSEHKREDTDIKTIVHEYMDDVEKMVELRNQGIVSGLPTGFPSVDEKIGGIFKGEIVVTAGPAKSGKSTLRLNIVRLQAKADATIVIFSGEMNQAAIVRKFISMETDIPVATLKSAEFTPQQFSLFVEASDRISQWNVHIIDDYKGLTPLDVRRELRRIMHNETVNSVLIDGLWLMRSNKPSDARHTAVADIMKDLVEIAAKMDVPIDLVHQMNRAAGTRRDPRPVLSDLGESIGVEQNAFTIIFLYRENYYKQSGSDETEIIIAANRDGNTGTAKLGFAKSSERYHEIERIDRMHIAETSVDDTRKDVFQ